MPKTLYLYLKPPSDAEGSSADLLRHCRFKLSNPLNLNDPFDMIPVFERPARPEDVRHYLEMMAPAYGDHRPIDPRRVAKTKEAFDNQDGTFLAKIIAENAGLVCTSECRDGVLLWAHYAKSHEGFAVGFNVEQLRKDSSISDIGKVNYTEKRPRFTIRDLVSNPKTMWAWDRFYKTKSPEWAYEQEWRALYRLKVREEKTFAVFAPEAITEIILGARCTPDSERILRQACEQSNLSGEIEILRGRLCDDRFAVEIQKSEWQSAV